MSRAAGFASLNRRRKGDGRSLGNVRVDLFDVPLKYGPDTTSRSEVIEFTVSDFLGAKWVYSLRLSPPLVVFSNSKEHNGRS